MFYDSYRSTRRIGVFLMAEDLSRLSATALVKRVRQAIAKVGNSLGQRQTVRVGNVTAIITRWERGDATDSEVKAACIELLKQPPKPGGRERLVRTRTRPRW